MALSDVHLTLLVELPNGRTVGGRDVSLTRLAAPLAVLVLIATGAVLRVYKLGSNSLWFDEAVIWDIAHVPLRDLVHLNELLNSAPPTYALLLKALALAWGNSEAQLRMLSVFGSVASLVVLAFFARRWLGWLGASVALMLAVFAPTQIHYARELREYSYAVLSAPLLFLCLEWLLADKTNPRRVAVYVSAASLAVAFQFGLAILVACAQLLYLLEVLRERSWRAFMAFCASCAVIAGVSYGIVMISLQGRLEAGRFTFWYLAANYLPEPTMQALFRHVTDNTARLVRFAATQNGEPPQPGIVFGFLAVLGIISLFAGGQQKRRALFYIIVPILLTLTLSLVRLYPYGGIRQNIYLLPGIYIAVAAGAEGLFNRLRSVRMLQVALICVLATLWIGSSWQKIPIYYQPGVNSEETRPVIEYVAAHAKPEDGIYLYHSAYYAFRYYWEDRGLGQALPTVAVIRGIYSPDDPGKYEADLDQCFTHSARCWVVFARHFAVDDHEPILAYLRSRYMQQDAFVGPQINNRTGTAAYLFARR